MKEIDFYSVHRMTPHTRALTSMSGEIVYLIEGEDRSCLIDTGVGIGSLRKLVETLTDRPVFVLLTHGHVDHAMGAPEFDEVYMNFADKDTFFSMRGIEGRKAYVQSKSPERFAFLTDEYFLAPGEPDFKDVKEGDVFDLGEITIEAFSACGHTPGSMAYLIREERTLITGDACNTLTYMFFDTCSPIAVYKKDMEKLLDGTVGKFDRIYLNHGVPGNQDKDIISGVIDTAEDILKGNTDDMPLNFMGLTGYIAKAILPDRRRVDGKVGNIVYNKDNVF